MNRDTYEGLSDAQRAAVDAVAESDLSALGGKLYDGAGRRAVGRATGPRHGRWMHLDTRARRGVS